MIKTENNEINREKDLKEIVARKTNAEIIAEVGKSLILNRFVDWESTPLGEEIDLEKYTSTTYPAVGHIVFNSFILPVEILAEFEDIGKKLEIDLRVEAIISYNDAVGFLYSFGYITKE